MAWNLRAPVRGKGLLIAWQVVRDRRRRTAPSGASPGSVCGLREMVSNALARRRSKCQRPGQGVGTLPRAPGARGDPNHLGQEKAISTSSDKVSGKFQLYFRVISWCSYGLWV